jgi:hypothetical protein
VEKWDNSRSGNHQLHTFRSRSGSFSDVRGDAPRRTRTFLRGGVFDHVIEQERLVLVDGILIFLKLIINFVVNSFLNGILNLIFAPPPAT